MTIKTTSERSMARMARMTEYFSSVFKDFTRFAHTGCIDRGKFLAICIGKMGIGIPCGSSNRACDNRGLLQVALIKQFPNIWALIKLNLMISGLLFHSGRFSMMASSTSPVPIGQTLPVAHPVLEHKVIEYHCASLGYPTLLTARITGLWVLYKIRVYSSASVIPSFPETTKMTTS